MPVLFNVRSLFNVVILCAAAVFASMGIAECVAIARQYMEKHAQLTVPRNFDLTGNWCAGRSRATIVQQGSRLTFRNEIGMETPGYFKSDTVVIAEKWGSLQGVIADDGQSLRWRNNTLWRRKDDGERL